MTDKTEVWYKQFWPWFLMALPMIAVVGSINLAITAIENKPDMVVGDYYAQGKAINNDFALLNRAKELNIHASIKQTDKELLISFEGVEDKNSMSFSLYHSTLAERDITVMLTADANGIYHFESDKDLTGKWRLRIEPFNKKWRLEKIITLPRDTFNL